MKDLYTRTKTRRQLADEYGITPRTLRRWLKKYDIALPNRFLCPKEIEIIYEKFGNPQKEDLGKKPEIKRFSS